MSSFTFPLLLKLRFPKKTHALVATPARMGEPVLTNPGPQVINASAKLALKANIANSPSRSVIVGQIPVSTEDFALTRGKLSNVSARMRLPGRGAKRRLLVRLRTAR